MQPPAIRLLSSIGRIWRDVLADSPLSALSSLPHPSLGRLFTPRRLLLPPLPQEEMVRGRHSHDDDDDGGGDDDDLWQVISRTPEGRGAKPNNLICTLARLRRTSGASSPSLRLQLVLREASII